MSHKIRNIHEHMVRDILNTGSMIDHAVSGVFREYGLTHVQYNILRILKASLPNEISVGELKNRILFSNCDITRLLDRLAAKGIISREPCPSNRRKIHVNITEKGLALLDVLSPEIASRLNNFYCSLITDEEAGQLTEVLNKIRTGT